MHIPGHLAIALAQHCLLPMAKDKKALKPLLLASLFPDMADKTIGYVFQAMPNGRHYAHNIFTLIGLSLVVSLIWGKSTSYAWFMGYLGHLLADSQTMVPWFFPARKYNFKKGRLKFAPAQFIRETMYLGLVLVIHRLSH
jgi:hypothetical protein